MDRDEVYVVNPATGERYAVPRRHFETRLQPDGWAIDGAEPAATEAIERAVVEPETEAVPHRRGRNADPETEG